MTGGGESYGSLYSGFRFDNHFCRRRWASRCLAFFLTLGFETDLRLRASFWQLSVLFQRCY